MVDTLTPPLGPQKRPEAHSFDLAVVFVSSFTGRLCRVVQVPECWTLSSCLALCMVKSEGSFFLTTWGQDDGSSCQRRMLGLVGPVDLDCRGRGGESLALGVEHDPPVQLVGPGKVNED